MEQQFDFFLYALYISTKNIKIIPVFVLQLIEFSFRKIAIFGSDISQILKLIIIHPQKRFIIIYLHSVIPHINPVVKCQFRVKHAVGSTGLDVKPRHVDFQNWKQHVSIIFKSKYVFVNINKNCNVTIKFLNFVSPMKQNSVDQISCEYMVLLFYWFRTCIRSLKSVSPVGVDINIKNEMFCRHFLGEIMLLSTVNICLQILIFLQFIPNNDQKPILYYRSS